MPLPRPLQLRPRRWFVALAVPLLLALAVGAWCFARWADVALPEPSAGGSWWLLDRSGRELAHVRAADGELMQSVRLEELSSWLVPATLAAEDARFFSHPGVDA